MDWLGIGVLIIGVAFAVLVILLIKPINKLSETLDDVQKTTNQLPGLMNDVSLKTAELLDNGNATLKQVNKSAKEIDPYFEIIGDLGEASHELTTSALHKATEWKTKTTDAQQFVQQEKYAGVLGILSFFRFLKERKRFTTTTIDMDANDKNA
ncbi:DUF948 domain-containing protein [Sporosarcina sp. Te-1]|uniref:DUF948 domain-containing protein n=1 Tax=Sporosarcina sp. Te-1 TaxID=2818390 RepID=UPI001A9D75F3|nr:DUF948 domain-containing protein [Sporosarcina sp. Te-1]QTD41925.1 DUF948 domain-containing protein [Sporosarcina sp. Te-1]